MRVVRAGVPGKQRSHTVAQMLVTLLPYPFKGGLKHDRTFKFHA